MKIMLILKLSALLAVSLLLTLPALAHTELVSATPAPGAVVPPTLAEIRLTFNEPLLPGSAIELLTESFQSMPGLVSHLEGSTMSAKPTALLTVGRYTVQWKAVGEDGHVVEGSYPFSVSPEAPNATMLWAGGIVALFVIVGLSAIGYTFYRRKRL